MDDIQYHVGIQVNLSPLDDVLDDKANIAKLRYLTNNLGDCYETDVCPLPNSMNAEKTSVELFASWLGLSHEDCWGYIGGGSSLGNLQGMWIGKELYPDSTLIFSKSAHYSIYKFASLLGFRKIIVIDTHFSGEMDVGQFKEKTSNEKSIVVVFTAGTTMTSGYDPIKECIKAMDDNNCNEYYIHLDAALGGAVTPFISRKELQQDPDDFSFKNKNISSITVSTHKVLGSPMPANLFIARKSVIDGFKEKVTSIPYLSHIKDITVYGSRDGFRASTIYSRLINVGRNGLKEIVQRSFVNCTYLLDELRFIGLTSAFRVSGGLAVVIPRELLNEKISKKDLAYIERKYHLVKDDCYYHIYVMNHVDNDLCKEIIRDFEKAIVSYSN